jgi:SAM-dependent methyltransferase
MANVIKAALSRFYFALSPMARKVLPKPVLRFVLLRLLGVHRHYKYILKYAGRQFLEGECLPWLRQNYRRILFVGAAPYTYQYERLFRQDHDQYTTIDNHPSTAVWGGPIHIVARIQDISRYRPKEFFDCIVFNGVFGFGIDHPDAMREAARAMSDVLRPGGLLIVGWNTDLHEDPEQLGVLSPFFVRTDQTPWGRTRRYPAELHVYDFYVKSPREIPIGR